MTEMDPALRDRLLDAAHRRARFLEECLRPGAPARVVPSSELLERAAMTWRPSFRWTWRGGWR